MKAVAIANPFRWSCRFIRKEGGASLIEKDIIHTHSIDAEIPQVGGERSFEGKLSIRAGQTEGGGVQGLSRQVQGLFKSGSPSFFSEFQVQCFITAI